MTNLLTEGDQLRDRRHLRFYLTDAEDLLWIWPWKRSVSLLIAPLRPVFNALLSFENPLPA